MKKCENTRLFIIWREVVINGHFLCVYETMIYKHILISNQDFFVDIEANACAQTIIGSVVKIQRIWKASNLLERQLELIENSGGG